MKRALALVLCVSGLLLAGCFDIEQTISINRDLSGKAGFAMTVDMEPMALFMLYMQREMEGKTGEPTKEELAKAREELKGKMTKTTETSFNKDEVKKELPTGVELLDAEVKEEGLKIKARFLFGVDRITKLSELRLEKKDVNQVGAGEPQRQDPHPFAQPFDGFEVKDEGATILVTTKAVNPVADQKSQTDSMDVSPDAKKLVEQAFSGLRFAVKIEAPFEVVEHNATRKEGKTLIWEYDLKSLEKMTPEQMAQGVRVRFKK
jgi:hypothetical protein